MATIEEMNDYYGNRLPPYLFMEMLIRRLFVREIDKIRQRHVSGLKITGALNWAPPREGVGVPQTISQRDAFNASSNWLSLARLTGEVGSGLGLGFVGDFNLSLHEGRLILALKASVVAGPGGWTASNLKWAMRRYLPSITCSGASFTKIIINPLGWVEPEASDFMSKISLLGAIGLDPAMIYLMAYDKIMTLYEGLFKAGRGGIIADIIMNYRNQTELRGWLIDAPPQTLGALFYTLISKPAEFKSIAYVSGESQNILHSDIDSHYLQQQAIHRIITWLAKDASTKPQRKTQFVESCKRINKFGILVDDARYDYCRNRALMDSFMRVPVKRLFYSQSDAIRKRYLEQANTLGEQADKICISMWRGKS